MRFSNYFVPTLKELPADAVLPSQQLMLRAGMIRKIAAGLYTWLPLGIKVLHKVEKIIRQEMNNAGALEVLMPSLQPVSLWQKTSRLDQYGAELIRLQDRHKRDFCLGPTHEEIITSLVANDIKSYKQLPINLYQISNKYRDEIRPRFGVMRAREFIMKDAYSFHTTYSSLQDTYELMRATYLKIFARLGIDAVVVDADSGSIGGNKSQEFHVLADSGEDSIVFNRDKSYVANLELATSLKSPVVQAEPACEQKVLDTPAWTTISQIVSNTGVDIQDTVKTLIVKGKKDKFVALVIRGDHTLNEIKAAKHKLVSAPLTMATHAEISDELQLPVGFIGPIGLDMPVIVDNSAANIEHFVCGANLIDKHISNANWQRDCQNIHLADLRNVVAGDISPCGTSALEIKRGIEVGHIFQLGDKYTKAMQAKVLDGAGKSIYPLMGCYGIGVSRIVAAAIEQHASKDLHLPATLAPFELSLILIKAKDEPKLISVAEDLYKHFSNKGLEVLYFDGDERAGVKFANTQLLAIPHRLVISCKLFKQDKIEYQNLDTKAERYLDLNDGIVDAVIDIIHSS